MNVMIIVMMGMKNGILKKLVRKMMMIKLMIT